VNTLGKIGTVLVAGLICGCISGCGKSVSSGSTGYDRAEAQRYITESEKQWAESVASGNTADVERIIADDFLGVDTHGRLYDKPQMVSDTRKGPETFASNELNEVKVRFYGDTAVAQGSETWQKYNGERGRFVWTDTWLWRNGRWQIVAAEDVPVPAPKP
jgi:hypothetical protein